MTAVQCTLSPASGETMQHDLE